MKYLRLETMKMDSPDINQDGNGEDNVRDFKGNEEIFIK